MPSKSPPIKHFLTDLAIRAVHRELRPVYQVTTAETIGPKGRGLIWDFQPRDGFDNLSQAVIIRLLTPQGELTPLGHADFGSRVYELIGQGNTDTTRNLLKLFILDALQREPRIEKVVECKVQTSPGTKSTVDVYLRVKPVQAQEIVVIGPFSIELN